MYVSEGSYLSQLPSAVISCPPFTLPRDVIDKRIDVFAQRSLLRMFKAEPAAKADAHGLLCAVKTGRLAGIYKEDEQVPALRARKFDRGWWQIIPKGEDATLVNDPQAPISGQPIIVFRDSARSIPARLDPALRKTFRDLEMLLQVNLEPCPQDLPGEETILSGLPETDQCRVPSFSICSRMKKLDKAVCEFKARLKNPWLVCYGQSYWSELARDALENAKRERRPCKLTDSLKRRGVALYCALWRSYLSSREFLQPWPKSPIDLWQWFLERQKRELNWCDQAALQFVSGNKCFDTVDFVKLILARQKGIRRGKNTLGVALPESFIEKAERDSEKNCWITTSSGLTNVVQKLKVTLDNGYPVKAGVYPPDRPERPCVRAALIGSLGHYVLIIGHDGGNTFVYWNTGQGREDSVYGTRFGLLKAQNNQFASPLRKYQVVFLDSLVPKASVACGKL